MFKYLTFAKNLYIFVVLKELNKPLKHKTMTIYGIEIQMPHSGEVSRTIATTLLKNAAYQEFSRTPASLREACETLIKRGYTALRIEDVNYGYRAKLIQD